MVSYTREEIISASDIARGFSGVLKELMDQTKARFAVSKNNKLEAVVLPIEEYERLQEAYDMLEHIEIYNVVQERKDSKTLSLEASALEHGIDLDDL